VRRGVTVVAAGALVAGICAGTASAALWLVFSRTTAAPGDAVGARTAGKGAFVRPIRAAVRRSPPRVFLVERSEAQSVRSPTDARLVELGSLSVNRSGNGRLHFVVPNVPPGEYTALIHCRPCGRYSRGRSLLPAGSFRVTEAAPLIRDCSRSFSSTGVPETQVSAGPLTLAFFEAVAEPGRFAPIKRPSTYRSIKILALLPSGTTATLSVPVSERRHVALLYRRPILRQGEPVRVSDGDAAVTFKACTEGEFVDGVGTAGPTTIFGGGFVVAGARCASLILRVEGRPEPLTFRVPFGAPCPRANPAVGWWKP
jgi:hypothetical protein